jgi:hypothetical protein
MKTALDYFEPGSTSTPLICANKFIETGALAQSNCISCHQGAVYPPVNLGRLRTGRLADDDPRFNDTVHVGFIYTLSHPRGARTGLPGGGGTLSPSNPVTSTAAAP